MTYISFLLLFCSFFSYICIICLPSCKVNKYYYIQRRGVTLKSNRSRSLKMGPVDRSYSRACVTITSSGVCFVSKQLASTSLRRQVLSTLLVQRWYGSSGNVRLSNLLISSCSSFLSCKHVYCVAFGLGHRLNVNLSFCSTQNVFLPRDATYSADYAVARCPPSVCHTPVLCGNATTYHHTFSPF